MEIIELFRILAIAFSLNRNKSYQLTFDRLILLDFCLEHSKLMLDEDKSEYDFDSINAHYHLQPSRDSYYKRVHVLLAKGLIEKRIIKNQYSYEITDKGISLCMEFDNNTFKKMLKNADEVSSKYKGMAMDELQAKMYTRTKQVLSK
jgi:hypothetical protein